MNRRNFIGMGVGTITGLVLGQNVLASDGTEGAQPEFGDGTGGSQVVRYDDWQHEQLVGLDLLWAELLTVIRWDGKVAKFHRQFVTDPLGNVWNAELRVEPVSDYFVFYGMAESYVDERHCKAGLGSVIVNTPSEATEQSYILTNELVSAIEAKCPLSWWRGE